MRSESASPRIVSSVSHGFRFLFLGLLAAFVFPLSIQAAPVHVIELDDQIISPVTQSYITESISRAEDENAECLVILLDTPGGLMESARAIVKGIMNARVPIVVYVAPPGSRAGSAGVFITLAAHVAAMAPSTHIGAAHPVTIGGDDSQLFRESEEDEKEEKRKEPTKAEDTGTTTTEKDEATTAVAKRERDHTKFESPMADKILNDTVAWVRSIAKTRGRNVEWAEKSVTESVSITSDEALEENVIDLIAEDLSDLLTKIDGRSVHVHGQDLTLNTADAEVIRHPMSALQRFLAIITHPNVAYLLMMLGTLGLIFEFTHPGVGFPGIAGGVCLLLALYAFQVLPVSYVGVALVILGLVLLIAEVKITSYGMLALGGIVCLGLGGVLLFQSPDPALRVSLSLVIPTVLTMGAITLFLLHRVIRSRSYRVATGDQGMVGEIGEVTRDLNLEGLVFIHGETWKAESTAPVPRGAKIRVVRIAGLRLFVEPVIPDPTSTEGD